jgi:hypothetical protein
VFQDRTQAEQRLSRAWFELDGFAVRSQTLRSRI